MNALLNSLTEAELMLIRGTERDQLAGLDEDALVGLHTRIRRARPKNRRNAGKAELLTVPAGRNSDHPPLRIPSVTAAPTRAVPNRGLHLGTHKHHFV